MSLRFTIAAGFVLLAGLVPSLAYAQEVIRVRLLDQHRPRAVTVSGQDGGLHLSTHEGGSVVGRVAPGEPVQISRRGRELRVVLGDGVLYALSLWLAPEDGGTLRVATPEGQGPADPRFYPGALAIAADRRAALQLVNHLALDDYVAGVVAREYGFDDLEGSKAMAVVARTYALRFLGKRGDAFDHVDHVLAQQYDGVERITPVAREAVRETRGEVLTHDGRLIEAVYFASSGGRTANNEDVWEARPLPYLRGKRDPYDGSSPYTSWSATVPRDRLLALLSEHHSVPVEGFRPGARSADGRIRTVELLADERPKTVRANAFRLFVNRHFGKERLKSTRFEARREGSRYVFQGSGYGHGVGLSQWGARTMALRGYDYRDILRFYYTDVSLTPLDRLDDEAPPPAVPVALEEQASERRRIGW